MVKLSRRNVLSLAAAAAAAGGLSACGAGGGSSSGASSSGGGGASGELAVQMWDAVQKNGVQAAIDGFTAANPGVSVRLDVMPQDQYYQSLDSSLAAGQGPEVFWQSSRAVEYVEGGAIEPLDEYISAAGIDMSAYAPQITDLYNFDGKQYGIPKDMDAWVYIYNPALFDKYGVAVPEPDWTWDDMVKIGMELLDASGDRGNIIGYNLGMAFGISDSVWQLGGRFVSEDGTKALMNSPEAVEGFQRILDLMDAGLTPNPAERADFDNLAALTSGNLPMAMIPSWHISAVGEAVTDEMQFTAVRLPSTNGNYACNTNGLCYMMNVNTKDKDTGFELLKFLTSEEGAKLHGANGAGLPALPAAQESWFEANKAVSNIEAVQEASANLYLRPTTAFPKARPGFTESSTNLLPELWAKSRPVKDILDDINDVVQRALDA